MIRFLTQHFRARFMTEFPCTHFFIGQPVHRKVRSLLVVEKNSYEL